MTATTINENGKRSIEYGFDDNEDIDKNSKGRPYRSKKRNTLVSDKYTVIDVPKGYKVVLERVKINKKNLMSD